MTNPVSNKNLFAYSSHFSQNKMARNLYHAQKKVYTTLTVTVTLGALTVLSACVGAYPQAITLGVCTGCALAVGQVAVGSLYSLYGRASALGKQRRILRRLVEHEKNITDPKLQVQITDIKKLFTAKPFSLVYGSDFQRLHVLLQSVTTTLAQDGKMRKKWRRTINLMHGLSVCRADGRTLKLNLSLEKTILRKKTLPVSPLKVETLKKLSRKDTKALRALFTQQTEIPEFVKKRKVFLQRLKKDKLLVARDQKTKKIVGMLFVINKKQRVVLNHCARLAEQPPEKGIESTLIQAALNNEKNKCFKAVLFKSDQASQDIFGKAGFTFAGVKAGLYGSFEDGKLKMERMV